VGRNQGTTIANVELATVRFVVLAAPASRELKERIVRFFGSTVGAGGVPSYLTRSPEAQLLAIGEKQMRDEQS